MTPMLTDIRGDCVEEQKVVAVRRPDSSDDMEGRLHLCTVLIKTIFELSNIIQSVR